MSTTVNEDGRMLTVSDVVDEHGQPCDVVVCHEFDTVVTAVNPRGWQIHVRCPYCGAHHEHGVSRELDFTGPGGSYVAYRRPHCPCLDQAALPAGYLARRSDTCYRIHDPDGLVGFVATDP